MLFQNGVKQLSCMVVITLTGVMTLTACGGGSSGSSDNPNTPIYNPGNGGTVTSKCPAAITQQQMLNAVNALRATGRSCGGKFYSKASPLQWNAVLAKESAAFSENMATNNFFGHDIPGGKNGITRMLDLAQATATSLNVKEGRAEAGENLAYKQTSLNAAMTELMKSPTHCVEIMKPQYTHMGMSCGSHANTGHNPYWTQQFFGVTK